jgi:group I intron endonuclease
MNKCGIYKITCANTGKFYIGSSKNIDVRWYHHVNDLIKSRHHSDHLQHAFDKYGREAFLFEIIEECPESIKDKREQWYLDTLRPHDKNIGYNICGIVGNTTGVSPSQETRDKLADASRKMWSDPEIRERLTNHSKSNAKKQWAENYNKMVESLNKEEVRLKKRKACQKLWQDPEYRSKNLAARPPINRHKISEACLHAWADPVKIEEAIFSSPIRREIRCNETGVVYPSIAQAAKALGVAVKSIKKATSPGRTCKGNTFSYIEVVNENQS